jgi:Predicted membrane protein
MGTIQTLRSSYSISIKTAFTAVPPVIWFTQIALTSFFMMAFFVLLADYATGSRETMDFVAIGIAVQTIATSAMYSIANVPGVQKHVGTMEVLMSSPANLYVVFLGMSLFSMFTGFLTVGLSLGYAVFIFGVDFSAVNLLSMVVVMLVTALVMSCVGMAIGSIGLYLRTSVILANVIAYIGLVISGVNFPISELPGWLQTVAHAYPLTYAVDAMRSSVAGAGLSDIAGELGILLILGVIFAILSYVLFIYFEKRTKRTGRLDSF